MKDERKISFSPPDITEEEIDEVTKVLKSGWITSGPKVAEFEDKVKEYCSVDQAVAVNSATEAMELVLKVLNIKGKDEIITTPYTYSSTSSVALHRGVKPTLIDLEKDSFFMDLNKLESAINSNTKMIMPVDFGGVPCDYDGIKEVLKAKNREDIIILCDSAHSFGGKYKGEVVGSQCDFHTFSFHAVKNLTTSEGGAITYNENVILGKKDLYREFKITSLQGQTKDALSKTKAGAWEYDIITDGLKCNMTDISAAIGLVQLKRYPDMLEKRKKIFNVYTGLLKSYDWAIVPFEKNNLGTETSYHLYSLRIRGFKEEKRNKLIEKLAKKGIATNVHFKPLPLFTLYKNLGYKIEDYPNAFSQYENEISLPIYSSLSIEDAYYVGEELIKEVKDILNSIDV